MRSSAVAAVPALTQALRDEDVEVRVNVVIALARLGESAYDAIPMLTEVLRDESERVRQHAVYALKQIGTLKAESALNQL